MGYAELLEQGRDLDEVTRDEFLAVIVEKAEALEKIVDELLNLSRIESGHLLALDLAAYDITELVTGLIDQFRKLAPRHTFEVVAPEKALKAELDRGKMVRALENLLSNAVKYSPEGGPIRVPLEPIAPSQIQITVADRGIGMTLEQVERIFDKFYRGHTSNTTITGLGLGTTIAHSIIHAHGGRIWVESEPGQGTRVGILLDREQTG